jgi:3-oxoacyl-[acyl-carrier-protein] synthase-1
LEKEMAERIAAVEAHNIVTALGLNTSSNYAAAREGRTALQYYSGQWGTGTPFVASLVNREEVLTACRQEDITGPYTFFEKMAILSMKKALQECHVDMTSMKTLLILSTTKGNVDMLRENIEGLPTERELLGEAAQVIASYFGMKSQPIVVSNACISGACAQIEASRMIATGCYDHVVVCGVDVLSPFIVSGFQSLQALSDQPCRPFDEDRTGINLGDAAATIVFHAESMDQLKPGTWYIAQGAIRNDAFHITNPSRTGEGCYKALSYIMEDATAEELAFVNAHGTATLFNDEMESVALSRAGLDQVPVNSLKGIFGHTMGAAGVLETIISMQAANEGIVLGTKGYRNLGVSRSINVDANNGTTHKQAFVKMMSGFGGCNAAILFRKNEEHC